MNLIAPTLIICDVQQFIGTQSPRRGMSVGCLFAGKRTCCQHGEAMVFVLGLSINARHLMHSQNFRKWITCSRTFSTSCVCTCTPQHKQERNFHIFYYLTHASPEEKSEYVACNGRTHIDAPVHAPHHAPANICSLLLAETAAYSFLNQSTVLDGDTHDDKVTHALLSAVTSSTATTKALR